PRQRRWWTAQGRFGRPLRVKGVQQPAPPLYCRAGRSDFPPEKVPGLVPICQSFGGGIGVGVSTGFIEVSAPFATPALNGKPLVTAFEFPKTRLCFLLYAEVVQSDGATNRNILLTHCYGTYVPPQRPNEIQPLPVTQRDRMGYSVFATADIEQLLRLLGLPPNSALSVLAVELLPGGVGNDVPHTPGLVPPPVPHPPSDPLGAELGLDGLPQRILRVSTLVPIATICY